VSKPIVDEAGLFAALDACVGRTPTSPAAPAVG
jgi:hypothetical protein